MADSSHVDTNIITDATDSSGNTTVSVVQTNATESSRVDSVITTGGRGAKGEDSTVPGPMGPPGADGQDGQNIMLRNNGDWVQWKYEDEAEWTNLIELADLKGDPGKDGEDGLNGADGREVELQKTATHIQWRYEGGEWVNLVALADLKGADGDPGEGGGVNLYPRTPSGRWLHAWGGAFVTNQSPASGYVPIQIAHSQSFDAAGFQVTTGADSAQVHLALYDDDDGYPGSLIADFGIADLSTNGEKILTLGSPIAVTAGLYWMLALTNSSTIRLPVTAHTSWGQPNTLWHVGPIGTYTTNYQGGFTTSDTTPPSTAPSSMSTNRYIIIGSLRAA